MVFMKKRIAIVGCGALGGYVGGSLAHLGHAVTFVDPWPENVETIRARGLELDGVTPEERFVVRNLSILHVTEAQSLASSPVDIAMVSVKSYDTLWATALIAPYLAPGGFVVSLQNCLNEETIAGVVGWGRTVGTVASLISVDLYEAGRVRRTIPKGGDKHTVFRVGEPHGRITPRVEELVGWLRGIDSSKATTNLWGERWSKLVTNVMGNGLSACTGMIGRDVVKNDVIRHFSNRLGSEAIRVGQALGYTFDEVSHMDPETLARAGEGDAAAQKEIDDHRLAGAQGGGGEHRPSTGQDMVKGRRTEIPFLNGFVVRKGEEVGVPAPTNAILTEIVRRVEIGELKPDPKHITDLRLN
jgi:2-dehydropantoate 2-reductase